MKGFIEVGDIEIKTDSIVAIEPMEGTSEYKTRIYVCGGMTFVATKTKEEIKRLMCGGN